MKIQRVKLGNGEWPVIMISIPKTGSTKDLELAAVKLFKKKCYVDANFHRDMKGMVVVSPHVEVFCDGENATWPVSMWPDGVSVSTGGKHRIGRV